LWCGLDILFTSLSTVFVRYFLTLLFKKYIDGVDDELALELYLKEVSVFIAELRKSYPKDVK